MSGASRWPYVVLGRRPAGHCQRCSDAHERRRQIARIEFFMPATWADCLELGLDPEAGEPYRAVA